MARYVSSERYTYLRRLKRSNQGLEDLKAGIIRTPLAPRQTFLDDPLRVIRCVRFASRFGFEMVPELVESASDPEIQVLEVYCRHLPRY